MQKIRDAKYAALLVPVLALVLAGAVIAGGSVGDLNEDVEPNGDPPGSGCNCPQVYDPVVCQQDSSGGPVLQPNTWKRFTNSCFAGCEGYTRCRPAPAEVR